VSENAAVKCLQTPPNIRDSGRKTGGPFRATQLWNELISALRGGVKLKRRRVRMRQYDCCFTGSDAVDVVLNRLSVERFNFTKDISRDKAVKLCQLLMEQEVFESVADGNDSFNDSSSKLYRFSGDDKENIADDTLCSSCDNDEKDVCERIHCDLEPQIYAGNGAYTNPVAVAEKSLDKVSMQPGQLVQELMDITGAWKRYSSECLRRITPAKLFTRSSSMNDIPDCPASAECTVDSAVRGGSSAKRRRVQCDSEKLGASSSKRRRVQSRKALQVGVEEEVWREAVLSRLLTMVDLPVLDSILSYDPICHDNRIGKKELAFSNLAFQRNHDSFSSNGSDRRVDDEWLEAALDCLEWVGHDSASLTCDACDETRRETWTLLCKNYADKQNEPLWSVQFEDLHVSLFNLLMQGKRSHVLRALQLSVVLIPRPIKDEMKRLLTFMKLAAEDESFTLNDKMSNRCSVEQSFTSAIIYNKTLTPHQTGQLVLFMMDHVATVFSVPEDVEEDISSQLDTILKGDAQPRPSPSFCTRISVEEFDCQRTAETEQALVGLMNTILDNTTMSLKEKKQRFKHFQKHHATIYQKHFSDIH